VISGYHLITHKTLDQDYPFLAFWFSWHLNECCIAHRYGSTRILLAATMEVVAAKMKALG